MYLNCAPDIIDFRLNNAKLLGDNTIHNNALISRERNDEMAWAWERLRPCGPLYKEPNVKCSGPSFDCPFNWIHFYFILGVPCLQ